MTTDTERGRALLEARRDRIVTHTNVEDVRISEFRAFIDLALAVDQMRLMDVVTNEVDAALDALLAHLAGEGS
jgi:hypothetical protein